MITSRWRAPWLLKFTPRVYFPLPRLHNICIGFTGSFFWWMIVFSANAQRTFHNLRVSCDWMNRDLRRRWREISLLNCCGIKSLHTIVMVFIPVIFVGLRCSSISNYFALNINSTLVYKKPITEQIPWRLQVYSHRTPEGVRAARRAISVLSSQVPRGNEDDSKSSSSHCRLQ